MYHVNRCLVSMLFLEGQLFFCVQNHEKKAAVKKDMVYVFAIINHSRTLAKYDFSYNTGYFPVFLVFRVGAGEFGLCGNIFLF